MRRGRDHDVIATFWDDRDPIAKHPGETSRPGAGCEHRQVAVVPCGVGNDAGNAGGAGLESPHRFAQNAPTPRAECAENRFREIERVRHRLHDREMDTADGTVRDRGLEVAKRGAVELLHLDAVAAAECQPGPRALKGYLRDS